MKGKAGGMVQHRPLSQNEVRYLAWRAILERRSFTFVFVLLLLCGCGFNALFVISALSSPSEILTPGILVAFIVVDLILAWLLWFLRRKAQQAPSSSGRAVTISGLYSSEVQGSKSAHVIHIIGDHLVAIPEHWLEHFAKDEFEVTAEAHVERLEGVEAALSGSSTTLTLLSVGSSHSIDQDVECGLLGIRSNISLPLFLILALLFPCLAAITSAHDGVFATTAALRYLRHNAGVERRFSDVGEALKRGGMREHRSIQIDRATVLPLSGSAAGRTSVDLVDLDAQAAARLEATAARLSRRLSLIQRLEDSHVDLRQPEAWKQLEPLANNTAFSALKRYHLVDLKRREIGPYERHSAAARQRRAFYRAEAALLPQLVARVKRRVFKGAPRIRALHQTIQTSWKPFSAENLGQAPATVKTWLVEHVRGLRRTVAVSGVVVRDSSGLAIDTAIAYNTRSLVGINLLLLFTLLTGGMALFNRRHNKRVRARVKAGRELQLTGQPYR
jgi:hypothetical protein